MYPEVPEILTLYVGVVVPHCLISTSCVAIGAGVGLGLGVALQSTIASTAPVEFINKA